MNFDINHHAILAKVIKETVVWWCQKFDHIEKPESLQTTSAFLTSLFSLLQQSKPEGSFFIHTGITLVACLTLRL